MKVTHSELAQIIKNNGDCNYEDSFTKGLLKIARDSRLVILTTIGDDVLSFQGFFKDEADGYKGCDLYLRMEDGECFVYTKKKEGCKKISAFWEEYRVYKWRFLTLIPHSKFVVKRNGKNFSESIIFSVDDI